MRARSLLGGWRLAIGREGSNGGGCVGPCPRPPHGCSAAAFSGRSGPRLLGGYSLSRGPFPRPRSRGQVRGECGQPILIPAGAGLLQFGARRGPFFNLGPARPAAPTSYSGNARSLGPFPRHCRHCHERRLVVTRTLEEGVDWSLSSVLVS